MISQKDYIIYAIVIIITCLVIIWLIKKYLDKHF